MKDTAQNLGGRGRTIVNSRPAWAPQQDYLKKKNEREREREREREKRRRSPSLCLFVLCLVVGCCGTSVLLAIFDMSLS
jgi:hypothetical protein